MKEWAGLVARLVVGAVWVYAGALKLFDPAQSVAAVRAYELLPSSLVQPVGQLLPVIEVVVGLMLILGVLTRGAAVVSAVLFALFIAGIASVWARGMNIDCGCFGGGGYDPDAASKYPWEIARDGVLLLVSLFVAWLPSTRLSLDARLFGRAPEPAEPEGT
ncbi:MAG: MauE/DoxX family redox-associated membrane protein [Nocardioides sp.]